ncbi:DNA cytosine methyltransferase, partial [Bifidobacterium moukalabense]|uniref:DNA cytosine methyltransferase n=1 Tax=Bifidobacterium moukalabense TaxID=1333651 RepID=UPI001BB181D0
PTSRFCGLQDYVRFSMSGRHHHMRCFRPLIPHSDQQLYKEGDGDMDGLTVRRLTPLECERIQGFPDGWTDIPWKGKEHAPDSPRYKALGNSMAVPVMRWIGEGIQLVEGNMK